MWTNCTSVKDRLDNNETTILSYIRVVDSITVLCRDHLSLEVLKNLLVSFYVSVFVKMYICFFFSYRTCFRNMAFVRLLQEKEIERTTKRS